MSIVNIKDWTVMVESDLYNADKFEWMYHNNAYAIVEDRLKTVNEIPSCYKTYLVNREWNIGRETESHVKRVRDLLQAVEDYFNV